jgi:alpha-beta hydrolase superfamily lysophospholipase
VIGLGEDQLMSTESDVDRAHPWGWAAGSDQETTQYQWNPPSHIAVRGTVVVLPGRGEHAGVYGRLGARLAVDGYHVVSADRVIGDGDPWQALRGAVADIAARSDVPLVLLGSDVGATLALRLASVSDVPVAGVVAAGLSDGTASATRGWDDELDARTACPTHRALLDGDPTLVRGALRHSVSLPAGWPVDVSVRVLFLHGGQDTVSDPETARALARRLPGAEVSIVRAGRHDVLNDLQHRSVAAEVVQFLERLRGGPDVAPILVRDTAALAS